MTTYQVPQWFTDRALSEYKESLKARHDVRDRRANNMEKAIAAIEGCAADLTTFAGNEGIAFLVADKLQRLAVELEGFKARDLLNLQKAS